MATKRDRSNCYNQSRDPYAVITVQDQLSPQVTGAKYVEAQLTFGGVPLKPVYYSPANYTANQLVDFAQEFNAQSLGVSLSNGVQAWTMTITEDYANPFNSAAADQPITRTYSGDYDYENLDDSPFGKGWLPQSLDRLYPQADGSVELADGAGNMYYYAGNPAGGFVTPPNAPGSATLAAITVDGAVTGYTLTDENHNVEDFNTLGQLTTQADSEGNTTSYSYEGANDNISAIVNQSGQTESFHYNAAGQVDSVVDFNGRTSTLSYNGDNQLIQVVGPNPDDPGESALTTTFTYNSAGLEATMVEKDAATTYVSNSFGYDPFNGLTAIVDEIDGHTQTFNTPQDQALTTLGATTTTLAPLVYDSSIAGTQTDEDGNTSTYQTGIYGEVASSTDPTGETTATTYNDMGEPLTITGPRLTSGPDAGLSNVTSLVYDANGNLTVETFPDDSSTSGTSTETWAYAYAPTWNEPTEFVDPQGRTTTYVINQTNGEVESMTQVGQNGDADRTTSYTYTPAPTAQDQTPGGLLATETDPRGITTSYSYNVDGLVTEKVEAFDTPDALTTDYAYDSQNDLTAVSTINVNTLSGATTTAVTHYIVDGEGRAIETDAPPPNPADTTVFLKTTDVYDALGNVVSETQYNVNPLTAGTTPETTLYQYTYLDNEDAELTKVVQPDGTSLGYSYDAVGNLLQSVDAMGRVTTYAYDADNRQFSEQDPNPVGGGASGGPVTSVVYGPAGNVVAQFDAQHNETDNTYDLRGNLRTSTGPAAVSGGPRPTISYAYNADQELTGETNALGGVTTFTYNSFGELTERQDPKADPSETAGPITKYLYDADGNQTAVIDPNTATTYFSFDSQNRLVEEIDPSPGVGQPAPTTTYHYDSLGELIEMVDPQGRITQYQYDADGNRTATIAPSLTPGQPGDASTTTGDVYDLEGNRVAETTPNGATTTWQYDLMNRPTEMIQPAPTTGGTAPVTAWHYDADGELTATVSPLGLTQTESYDGLGNMLSEVAFDGVTTSNGYNVLSQLVSTEQEGGTQTANQVTNTYDALGRLTTTTELGAAGNNDVTQFGYDLAGDRTSLTDSDGNQTTWQYDGLGRPIAERLPTGALDTFKYDKDGNLLQSVDGDGHVIGTTFDALDRPTTQTWSAPAAVLTTPSDTIDTVTLEDGVAGGSWTLAYNGVSSQSLLYNADAAQVQAALDAIPALSGNVAVSGLGGAGQPFVITFVGALANQGSGKVGTLTGDFNSLTVGSSYQPSSSSVSTLNVGGQGFTGEQQQVVGYVVTGGLAVAQGDFTLSFNGQTTGDIPYNATAAQVQTALAGLSTIGSGNVMVTGGDSGDLNTGLTGADLYTVGFTGAFGGGDTTLPQITIQSAGLADKNGQTSDVTTEAYTLPPAAPATAAPASAAAQQLVVTAATGSFTLGFQTETTASIDLPTTAAAVQAALAALPLIGTGNVQVIGSGTWASPFYISFTGDMAGQNLPAVTVESGASVGNTVVTSYNADSQTATIGDNFSDYAYQYDGQGNTATVDNAGTPGVPHVVLTSVYDAMGNRTSLAASIGGVKDFINNYSYDALSRLYDVIQQGQSGGNAVAPKQVYYKLDGIGDVTEVDRSTSTEIGPNPNGFSNSIYSYNTLGQLTGINHESNGASVDDLTYTYDGVGRVWTFGSIDGSVTYGYDPMSQLTSAIYTAASGHTEPPNLSLNFDTNGNRTTVNGTSTTVAPDNHLANDGTFTFGYDGAGNLISRTRISNAAANDYQVNYSWDAANRLVEVQDLNNSDTLTQQLNYTYDVYGRLIERVDDVIGGATTTVHYVWDADGMVLAFDGNGNLTTRYLNGPNTSAYDQYFATLAEEDVTSPTQQGTTTWPELDAQGSVVDVANNTGAIIDHIEYNATGAVFSESNPSVSHIGSFQGGYLDPATGLEKSGDRWEEMADAVWTGEDPIGVLGGINLTAVDDNDPANESDPSGLISDGHHIVPQSLFKNKVAPDVQKFFNSAEARIANEAYTCHNYKTLNGVSHPKYNTAVKEQLMVFLEAKNTKELRSKLKNMSLEKAKEFLTLLKEAPPDSRIGLFLAGVREEADKALADAAEAAKHLNGAKQVARAEEVASGGAKAILKKGANRVARVARVGIGCIPIIGYGADVYAYPDKVRRKGRVGGTIDAALDMTPGVEYVKAGLEVATGEDIIPDNQPDRPWYLRLWDRMNEGARAWGQAGYHR